jgi:hypothetical protein
METAFAAIGIEIPNKTAFHNLAEDVGRRGEATILHRPDGVLHGRCLKLGKGLEVWTFFYESGKGKVVYADCRPAFRARYLQKISPWILSEFAEEGRATIHGFIENSEIEVLFDLQNLTEVGVVENQSLCVGLCGLASDAEIIEENALPFWRSYDESALNVQQNENDWSLGGKVLAFEIIRNPHSGKDLFWVYVDVGGFQIEILVNQRAIDSQALRVGKFIRAEIWLQGHIINNPNRRFGYEGIDWSVNPINYWKNLRKPN